MQMFNEQPLSKSQVIGKRVRSVLYYDLPFDKQAQFQPRLTVVELESGLRFMLQQDTPIVDPVTHLGHIFSCPGSEQLHCVLDSSKDQNLASPIESAISPYGWDYEFGLLLENGFALHSGFSSWDNGLLFYLPDAHTLLSLHRFELPES